MLDATILKGELKPALVQFWQSGFDGDEGMSVESYADQFAQILAEKIVAHITANAVVKVLPGQTVAILPAPPTPPAYSTVLISPAGPVTGTIITPGADGFDLELKGSIT